MRHHRVAVLALLAACTAEDPELSEYGAAVGGGHHHHHRIDVAWLGNVPENTYDAAILDGARRAAAHRHARVHPFYGQFDPALQLEQCLEVVDSGHYEAILVIPTDPIGIIECVDAAAAEEIPVVAVDLPIGPDLTTVEPQVEGQAGAVLVPAATWGIELASLVVDVCTPLDSCNIVYLAGAFGIPFDTMALDELAAVEQAFPNVHVVATGEAFYDRALAQSVTASILATEPDVQIIIGAGDQMAQGAEDAVAAASPPIGPVKIIGAGGGAYAVDAIEDGRWYATFLALPHDEGTLGGRIVIRAARGKHVGDPGIDPVERRGLPSFLTQDNLATVDFTPQWPG